MPRADPAGGGGFLHRPGSLDAGEIRAWLDGVYRARADWTPCFGGVQFTLGRAYYTHLEEGQEDDYFERARASDAIVERAVPGLQERMCGILSQLLGASIVRRPGWCGPGLHIFPAGDWLAANGGDVHFDTEGLRDDELAARVPALSAIVMLQPPERGGGLRVWDALFDERAPEPEDLLAERGVASATVEYAAGDLVVIDSYRLHQIQPFQGERDRVSITAHLLFRDGSWQAWF
jgi:hypothetical protein